MKLRASQSPVLSDTGQIYYSVWGAELSYVSNAASRRVPSFLHGGRGGGGGVEIMLFRAFSNVRAELASWESLVELRQEASRYGRQWLGGGGDGGRLGGRGAV